MTIKLFKYSIFYYGYYIPLRWFLFTANTLFNFLHIYIFLTNEFPIFFALFSDFIVITYVTLLVNRQKPSQQNMPLGYHDGPRLVKVPGNVTWWHTTGLQPNSIYLVSLIAINDVGASRPSPRLRLTTDQEPPEGTATDIRAISNASQSILVTWKVHLLLLTSDLNSIYFFFGSMTSEFQKRGWRKYSSIFSFK